MNVSYVAVHELTISFLCQHNVTNMTIARQRFCKHRLKAGMMEPEGVFIAGQQLGEHFSLQRIATNESIASQLFGEHVSVTTDSMITNCLRLWSLFSSPKVIKGRTHENAKDSIRVEAGSNTSTVTL
jgi:hypothetical protein